MYNRSKNCKFLTNKKIHTFDLEYLKTILFLKGGKIRRKFPHNLIRDVFESFGNGLNKILSNSKHLKIRPDIQNLFI